MVETLLPLPLLQLKLCFNPNSNNSKHSVFHSSNTMHGLLRGHPRLRPRGWRFYAPAPVPVVLLSLSRLVRRLFHVAMRRPPLPRRVAVNHRHRMKGGMAFFAPGRVTAMLLLMRVEMLHLLRHIRRLCTPMVVEVVVAVVAMHTIILIMKECRLYPFLNLVEPQRHPPFITLLHNIKREQGHNFPPFLPPVQRFK